MSGKIDKFRNFLKTLSEVASDTQRSNSLFMTVPESILKLSAIDSKQPKKRNKKSSNTLNRKQSEKKTVVNRKKSSDDHNSPHRQGLSSSLAGRGVSFEMTLDSEARNERKGHSPSTDPLVTDSSCSSSSSDSQSHHRE